MSMSSGGAYLGMHAGFWRQLERTQGGRRFRYSVTSYSGSSAGALVAAPLSRGVPAEYVIKDVHSGGLGGHQILRALAVFFRLRNSMYNGPFYQQRWERLCAKKPTYPRVPVHIAVTNKHLQQRCLTLGTFATDRRVVTAAVASASIPYVMPAVQVVPEGACVDGSVSRASFPEQTVVNVLHKGQGTLLLLSCVPWPGFRHNNVKRSFMKRLKNLYFDSLYDHGMETLTRDIQQFKYQDGIFDIRVDNSSGTPQLSETGNLHVIFVAPTAAQYNKCGGNSSIAKLNYKASSNFIVNMSEQGKQMANEFIVRYCSLAL